MNSSKLIPLKTKHSHQFSDGFEYPHSYVPTKLAREAAKDLQSRLQNKLPELIEKTKGRMFGVLVVEAKEHTHGYLCAYSGEFQPELERIPFVPSVYQLPKGEDFAEMAGINSISHEIRSLEKSEEYKQLNEHLKGITLEIEENIRAAKVAAKKAKAERAKLRESSIHLPEHERQELLEKLARQGAHANMSLRRYVKAENLRLEEAKEAAGKFEEKIRELKALRKFRSAELQESIFKSFIFLNSLGESKDVKTVFNDYGVEVPPAGAGECAAPKLFQYAFQNNMKPLALAEFWWGPSPISEVREHGKFYPACKGKCRPILAHMLKGIPVKPDPLLENPTADKALEIIFKDQHLVIVNKPAGMLSVPGKHIKDAVQTRMRSQFPEATGPMIVHRLDQATSGIMIVTLSKEAHKLLQHQFIARSIRKTYIALLEKAIEGSSGKIELPLILDIHNRPMQKVNYEHGKPALTLYEVLDKTSNRTLIKLNPITGRSHQLRVHCAHKLGLHAPIVGDRLYGSRADRLYLHAQQIEFSHPITGKQVKIKTECPFSI